ncbi:MAG: hypothetical protein K0Q66_1929 [Chitinophagaceae bacterium]|jgi:hypothetical protein|nr:hypothetical protein [Chitinophagaceae bacterium]
MNRRKFLASGSLAALAVAGLPLAAKAKKRRNMFYPNEYKSASGEVVYYIKLEHDGVKDFDTASVEKRQSTMKVSTYKTGETAPDKQAEFKLTIESSKKIAEYTFEATAKVEKTSGEYNLPKEISKKIKLKCFLYTNILILGKKDETIADLKHVEDDEDYGCFLTTACVNHKGLKDDCYELETLRSLRDGYMANSAEGKALISGYKEIAPAMVKTIKGYDNSNEIYNYIYDHLVLPSVTLVEQGKKQEAVAYYKAFVEGMQSRYSK